MSLCRSSYLGPKHAGRVSAAPWWVILSMCALCTLEKKLTLWLWNRQTDRPTDGYQIGAWRLSVDAGSVITNTLCPLLDVFWELRLDWKKDWKHALLWTDLHTAQICRKRRNIAQYTSQKWCATREREVHSACTFLPAVLLIAWTWRKLLLTHTALVEIRPIGLLWVRHSGSKGLLEEWKACSFEVERKVH